MLVSLTTDTRDDLLEETRAAILEELDFPIKCVVRVKPFLKIGSWTLGMGPASMPCDKPAVAEIRCNACGAAGFICGDHRAHVLQQPEVTCVLCMATGPALVVYSFAPLSG